MDAGPLVALGDRLDPWHAGIRSFLEATHERLVIPAPVTAEADYLIGRGGGRDPRRRFLADLSAGRFAVESLTQEEHALALDVDAQYSDLDLGLADLSIIVLAGRYRTRSLITFDQRHFRHVRPMQGGFFLLQPADRGDD